MKPLPRENDKQTVSRSNIHITIILKVYFLRHYFISKEYFTSLKYN